MKVSRKQTKPEFIPVTITLETQEEVDKLYAILNVSEIGWPLGIDYKSACPWWEKLQPYKTTESNQWFNTLSDHLRKCFKK